MTQFLMIGGTLTPSQAHHIMYKGSVSIKNALNAIKDGSLEFSINSFFHHLKSRN